MENFANGVEHLLAELQRLDLMLQRQILRLRAARLVTENEFRGLYISDAQVDALLSGLSREAIGATSQDEPVGAQKLSVRIEQMRHQIDARAQASHAAGINLPLPRLARIFQLTPFEVEIFLIGVAPELDLRFETLYAYVQNDVTKKRPGVNLALNLLCPAFVDGLTQRPCFAAEATLCRHHLMRLLDDPQEREPSLLSRYIKIEQRLIDFLLENSQIDFRLLPFSRRLERSQKPGDLVLPEELVAQLTCAGQSLKKSRGLLFFQGGYGAGKEAAAAAVCAELDIPLLVADMSQALLSDLPFATLVDLLRRETLLQGAGLYLAHFEALLADEKQTPKLLSLLAQKFSSHALPIFLGSEAAWQPAAGFWRERNFLHFDFPLPGFSQRALLWQNALNTNGRQLAPHIDVAALANNFVFSAGQIADASLRAGQLTLTRAAEARLITMPDLYQAARSQSNQGLRRLAQKVEPVYAWSDIVLPPRAMQQLRAVCASVKYRPVVYSRWGFERKLALGKGLNVLFSGPSGTGKTMAAQILARELNLDLYKIDLANVVSKYIGETEKNLSSIFREAQASNAILFFDEADALFGKRSEVKDAHDRYANIEVAYLLQKMEEYEGIVILATNLSKNLDEAFARRMHHTVEFPFPDAGNRERIWRNMFPLQTPLADDIDFGFAARQFELAGGNIRNIALTAAFMAAEQAKAVSMEHLMLATTREFQKMGKLPSKTEFREYYELIRERG